VSNSPQAIKFVVLSQLIGQTHVFKLMHSPGRHTITASFVPRKNLSLHKNHIKARLRRPISGSGTRWAAAHNQQVVNVFSHEQKTFVKSKPPLPEQLHG
jgi:hypothetical protein